MEWLLWNVSSSCLSWKSQLCFLVVAHLGKSTYATNLGQKIWYILMTTFPWLLHLWQCSTFASLNTISTISWVREIVSLGCLHIYYYCTWLSLYLLPILHQLSNSLLFYHPGWPHIGIFSRIFKTQSSSTAHGTSHWIGEVVAIWWLEFMNAILTAHSLYSLILSIKNFIYASYLLKLSLSQIAQPALVRRLGSISKRAKGLTTNLM